MSSENSNQTISVHRTSFVVTPRYEILSAIGFGGYGSTVCVRDTTVAVEDASICLVMKKLDAVLRNKDYAWSLARQLLLLKDTWHPNCLRIRDVLVQDKLHIYLVYEQLECNLAEVLRASEVMTKSHIQHIIVHIARGLKYLHANQVVLCNLQPEGVQVGITLAAQGSIRIGDFNCVRKVGEPMPTVPADNLSWYMAPECVLKCTEHVTTSMDLWSLGCLLVELYTARPLFSGSNYLHQLQSMVDVVRSAMSEQELVWVTNKDTAQLLRQVPHSPSTQPMRNIIPGADKAAVDLVKRLLKFNPAERITAADVLAHPFCVDVDSSIAPLPKELRTVGGTSSSSSLDWALPSTTPLSTIAGAIINVSTQV